tara:strand:- start:396 stop:1241 length:846 start_codon:yes stop_codon:yes gene_type:complete
VLTFTKTGDGIGAFVEGFDADNIAHQEQIREALFEDYLLLIFRGLPKLNANALIHIAKIFGENLSKYFRKEDRNHPETDEILILSNVDELGSLGASAELPWHTNLAYLPQVASVALLYGEVPTPPEGGGATLFADTRCAYDSLAQEIKNGIENLTMIQSQGGYHVYPGEDVFEGIIPQAEHSLVRVHPRTGRKSLYCPGGRFFNQIPGMDQEQAKLLSKTLLSRCTNNYYRHEWEPGDLLIWDNLSTLHQREIVDPSYTRIVHVIDVLEDEASGTDKSKAQ